MVNQEQKKLIDNRELEAALEERRQLQVLLDKVPTGILITDVAGRFIRTNRILTGIWGGALPAIEDFGDYEKFHAWWSDTGFPLKVEEWAIY